MLRPGIVAAARLLLCLAVLGLGRRLARPELGNFLVHLLLHPALQLLPVAKGEQQLQPHKEWRQENSLQQVVQQRRGPVLKLAVADKLQDPRGNVCRCGVGGDGMCVKVGEGVVAGGGTAQAKKRQNCAGDGF